MNLSIEEFIFYALVVGFVGGAIYRRWQFVQSRAKRAFLVAMNAEDVLLTPIAHGQINSLSYALLVGGKSPIMHIELPFQSRAHIVALGHQDSDFEATMRGMLGLNKSVQRVELEGDFPDYFHLYTEPFNQTELRQILDPGVMAFLVDFAEENDWELIGSSLYMVNRGQAKSAENDTPMTADAQAFAARIIPTLERMSFGRQAK